MRNDAQLVRYAWDSLTGKPLGGAVLVSCWRFRLKSSVKRTFAASAYGCRGEPYRPDIVPRTSQSAKEADLRSSYFGAAAGEAQGWVMVLDRYLFAMKTVPLLVPEATPATNCVVTPSDNR